MPRSKANLARPVLFALPALILLLQACAKGPITAPNIDKFGPRTVNAGVAFNKQADGNSALWVHSTNRLAKGAVVLLNGQKLVTRAKADSNVATAEVPAALYAQPGSYSLQIVEEAAGKQLQSNVVQFVVKSK